MVCRACMTCGEADSTGAGVGCSELVVALLSADSIAEISRILIFEAESVSWNRASYIPILRMFSIYAASLSFSLLANEVDEGSHAIKKMVDNSHSGDCISFNLYRNTMLPT